MSTPTPRHPDTPPLRPSAPPSRSLNLKAGDAHRARLHYIDHFGSPNRAVSVANTTLVLLDAPGLVEEDYQRAQSLEQFDAWVPLDAGPVAFVRGLGDVDTGQLSVLRTWCTDIDIDMNIAVVCECECG